MKKYWRLFWLFPILILLLFSCPPPKANDQGTLALSFAVNGGSRTSIPDVNMTPEIYVIVCTGPDGVSREITVDDTAVTIENLTVGVWSVRVDALNADGLLIAQGETEVKILAGETNRLVLDITPLVGPGDLEVNLNWTAGCEASITATLFSAGGIETELKFASPTSTGIGKASISALPAGYYRLELELENDCGLPAGQVEVVRILAGQITVVDFNFTKISGEVVVDISVDMDNPIAVSMIGQKFMIEKNKHMTVTALVPDEYSGIIFTWYLNNRFYGNGKTVDVLIDRAGEYTLTAIVVTGDGMQGGSAAHQFVVVEEPVDTTGRWGNSHFGQAVFGK